MASLTFETATKPSATSGTTHIERNRSKLEAEILPTDEGLVLSVKTIKCNKHSFVSWAMSTNEPGYVLASSVLAQFLFGFKFKFYACVPWNLPHPSLLQAKMTSSAKIAVME